MRKTVMALHSCIAAGAVALFLPIPGPAFAQESTYSLTVQNGRFEPSTLSVKAGVKFKLVITNKGAKPAEFESAEMNREKIVPAGGSVQVYIGPLAPGAYPFFDDFDQKNRGQIVAK
jgi:RPA family protein